ncbi:MAG: hypothetical protein FD133_1492 [Erysipelotrichaceae bacterium]|nr:MAG: hypothetical protein FD179_1730 [Erysipelotrichaceae bacterium]TXT17199.1 MAG: hypothetical protein FD133_1492 [Erysipelotrichaceae bacterium]
MKSLAKNTVVYSLLTVFMIVFSFVYHLFSHGVSSKDMQFAFVWFLLSAGIYSVLLFVFPKFEKRAYYRLFMNLLNTASAWQVFGLVLKGVVDIAGGSSAYVPYFFIIANVAYGLSILAFVFVCLPFNRKKA